MADILQDMKEQADLCTNILAFPEHLTSWESDFLMNIRRRLKAHYPLSAKQREVLAKLEAKIEERTAQ